MLKAQIYALLVGSALILGGCASSSGYTQSNVGDVKSVKRGTVLEARGLKIGDDYKGAASGAAIGGLAGSALGKGDGKVAAVVGGALLGALAGSSLNSDAGQELVIKLDNGDVITTVYRVDKDAPFMFRANDRVIIEMLNAQIVSVRMAQ